MPRDTVLDLTAGQWVQLTAGDVTAMRVQNQTQGFLELTATTGAAPAGAFAPVILAPLYTWVADTPLAQIWPGVAGADRIFARSPIGGRVSVSHA